MMKKITLFASMLFIAITLMAQTPQAFKYQAVARDASGNGLANQNVSFRISILQGNASGISVYSETHAVVTNEYGLVNLEIGNGSPVGGDFSLINWANDSYFIKVEMDETGESNYQFMGTSQLLSVPFAMHAGSADSLAVEYTETDPEVGTNSLNYLSKWDGSALGASSIYDNGYIGIGTENPVKKLTVAGNAQIQSDGEWYPGATARLYLGPDDNMWIEHVHSGGLNLEVCSG
jgi:hypothetical protein